MIRLIGYLLAIVVLITVIRSVIGFLARVLADFTGHSAARVAQRPAAPPALGGELKKDPVCGTYIAESASIKKTVGGAVVHFCSPECRDKYSA